MARHKGHESTHSTMALILLLSLLFSQYLILFWKSRHPRSFNALSTLGMWIIPPVFALYSGSWRFLTIWALFGLVNAGVIWKASEKPLNAVTPRLVYKWYATAYSVTYGLGAIGYVLMFVVLFGALPASLFEHAITLFFYGVYFGVLSRDLVDRLSERMAATMGYYTEEGMPTKFLRSGWCSICGSDSQTFPDDKMHTLVCGHAFHEKCIRGWVIVGKKAICPYCRERVDTSAFQTNVWDAQQVLYLSLLDFVRYLVVWQPVIFAAVQVIFWLFRLD
ncbi:hypothetical protein DFJ74DRAFT_604738 [Hyaloraphidium curvatum]|nr:hypothetical protein DFJ74DRAFT_604738 [Hyaloraphidium curvatum]